MYARFMCIYAWKYQDVEKEFCRFIYQNFKKEYYNCIPNITIFLTGHTKKIHNEIHWEMIWMRLAWMTF